MGYKVTVAYYSTEKGVTQQQTGAPTVYHGKAFRISRQLFSEDGEGEVTIIFSILHVLPGTELYTNADKFGLEFDDKAPHLVLKSDTFAYDEIDKAVVMAASVQKEYNLKLP